MEKVVNVDWEKRSKVYEDLLNKFDGKGKEYDYLMLFSGGKDSSYLAYQLKQMKGKRVCLFTVDNGFGENNFIEYVKEVASNIGLDHIITEVPTEEFDKFISFVIKTPEFTQIDQNPVCFFCGNYIRALGTIYAAEHGIPAVIHGITPSQYNLEFDLNFNGLEDRYYGRGVQLLEKERIKRLDSIYEKLKQMEAYNNDIAIRNITNAIFNKSDNVQTISPFLYLEYSVEKIKKTIEDKINWKNIYNISNDNYISSGCQLFNISFILQSKINGFKVHELDEYEKDYKNGIISKSAYKYVVDLATKYGNNIELIPDIKQHIKRLNLEEIFSEDL